MSYKTSPLPFQGQKRNYLRAFKERLNGCSAQATYIDLFGGSGLLSNTVKEVYPNAQVVYNDYDDFRGRLAAIPTTNQILADLRLILANEPRGKMIRKEVKQQVISCVERYDKLGNVHIYANNIDATKDLLTGSDGVKFSLNV